MDILATEFKAPEGGLQIPWNSYRDLWVELRNVSADTRNIIESALSLQELVSLAAEKSFWESLKEEGAPQLRAKTIATHIQRKVYGKR